MKQGDITIQGQADHLPITFRSFFSRDLTTASGTQVITGVGFKPSSIQVLGGLNNSAGICIGFAGQTQEICIRNNHNETADTWQHQAYLVNIVVSSGNDQRATLTTMDTDGFTVEWVKTGSPTGSAAFWFLAYK